MPPGSFSNEKLAEHVASADGSPSTVSPSYFLGRAAVSNVAGIPTRALISSSVLRTYSRVRLNETYRFAI